MTEPSGAWRSWLSDLLIAAGALVLWTGALFWTRTALASSQVAAYRYLPAASRLSLPLPDLVESNTPNRLAFLPAPESSKDLLPAAGNDDPGVLASPPSSEAAPELPPVTGLVDPGPTVTSSPPVAATDSPPVVETTDPGSSSALPSDLAILDMPSAVPTGNPAQPTERPRLVTPTPLIMPTLEMAPDLVVSPEALLPTPTPTPVAEPTLPAYSPVIRIVIPALEIDRAVTPVGLKPGPSGGLEWDTDPLFATRNRPDLVGQLVGSYSPGQGGNILLIGHNYNQVDYGWTGVFVNIKNLKAGDLIGVFTEDGRQVNYQVQLIKQVPWRSQSAEELEKHLKFMGPSESELLTLVTCGGANIWPFPARVYVVAAPAS